MQNPIEYKSDSDRLMANAERERMWAIIGRKIDSIVPTADKLRNNENLSAKDIAIIEVALETMITEVYHADAEKKFLFDRPTLEE